MWETVAQDATVVDGIDLTVVLGKDFEAQVAKHAAATPVTSTTANVDDSGDEHHWLTR